MQMTQPGASERRATRLIFLLCGMAHSSWAPLVPYAKARVHANDQRFGLRCCALERDPFYQCRRWEPLRVAI